MRRFPRWRKAARWSLVSAAAVAALYFAAMNVFLETRMFRDLISFDPISFRLEYARAYSIFPGQIHVEDLAIRGRDSHVEWILHLDRCDFRVSFFGLTHRLFHASHVNGHGLSFRVRLRVAEATPEHLAALPPVTGFADPPLADFGPPSPPLSDKEYKLWGVELDDVDAESVHELWIDTLRYSGDLRVRGRWLFHPVRWLDVGPAIVDARTLDISYGMRPLVTAAEGVIHARVIPYDVRVPAGLEILDQVSANVALQGHLHVAAALQAFLPDEAAFARGEGPFEIAMAIDHGVLAAPTHVAIASPETEASRAGITMDTSLHLALDVKVEETGPPRATARLEAVPLDLARGDAQAHAMSAVFVVSSRELKLSHGFADATFRADVRDAETPSLQPWLPPLPPWDVRSGRATATLELEGSLFAPSGPRAQGHVSFAIDDLVASQDAARLAASITGDLLVKDASAAERSAELGDSALRLRDAVVVHRALTMSAHALALRFQGAASAGAGTIEGQATIEGEDLVVRSGALDARANLVAHVAGDGHVDRASGEGHVNVTGGDALLRPLRLRVAEANLRAPSVALAANRVSAGPEGLRGRVTVDVPRVETDDVAALARSVSLPNEVAIERGTAAAAVRLDGDLASRTATGAASIDLRGVGGHLASKALLGDLAVRLRAERRGDATVLSGSTVAFDSTPSPADPSAEGWWARAELSQAELRAAGGIGLHAHLHLTAKDGSPASALVASQTPIPKWLLAAVPFHDLDAAGDLRLAPSRLEVRAFTARGGDDRVELEYASQDQKTEWALLVEAGSIGAGFHLRDGHIEFALFDARPWYQAKVALLRDSNEQ